MSGHEWTVILQGDWYLPHLVNMLNEYKGNSEQTLCRDEMVQQIQAQVTSVGGDYKTAHPLVVIDPEDREQVERLREAASRWADRVPYANMREDGDLTHLDAMQAALREFADPKPSACTEEPRDLAARIVDRDGDVWARADNRWGCLTTQSKPQTWRDLVNVCGPLHEVTP
ncbi:hypothetical protein EFK50_07685 [Nocardioides marmoriginsengisoli]|uniref:Uncharacterized protein n=1 Tax=Nocardioides marmoriginsengisoli TaxID=661483 RepID=A0A3N0CMV4_9ACTN|nr:hypothetical protein [Nocardioides marmoriginsengisoli]RNL64396.1 hypothetical protein EFK50_07685 [Nocardioides marmoriginsengisoli]